VSCVVGVHCIWVADVEELSVFTSMNYLVSNHTESKTGDPHLKIKITVDSHECIPCSNH
jgi:hypothetical protein